jgi:DUF4097 and DUF4098 domain-containing protein YvlB
MRTALLFVPLLTVACSYPRFTASKTVEAEVPLEQAIALHCKTHNGDITITRGDASDTIQLHTVMKVRGHTQEEADDNLRLLSVAHEVHGETLKIYGKYPRPDLNNRSPSFTYTMKVPEHLALTLLTHNGNVRTDGTTGALRVETHNGDVIGAVQNQKVWVETHNGEVELAIDSGADLDGRIVSHNGDIDVVVSADARCWLEAATHNGHIDPPATIHDADIKRRSLRCRLGEANTDGRLFLKTHNGDIEVASGAGGGGNEFK